MRLIGRKPDEPSSHTADVVLQLGSNKIQLPAEKLNGIVVGRVDDQARAPSESTSTEQDKAVDALMRMRQTLQHPSTTTLAGHWAPFSPDDLYPTAHHRSRSAQTSGDLIPPSFPAAWDRRPSNNLPEAYDPTEQPVLFCPAVPNPDFPLRHKPTIFEGLGDMPRPRPSPLEQPRKCDSVSGKKSRRLRHLLTERSASTAKDPATSSSRAARTRSGSGLAASPSTSANARRVHDFGDDVVQATKTNVRRPPKGIQNWFDGYPISDDDEDDEDEEEGGAQQARPAPVPHTIPPAQVLPEPQELPAEDISPPEDVPPPAYSNIARVGSTASRWSNRSYTPGDDNPPPFNSGDEKTPANRTQSVSTATESLHSTPSQIRRQDSDPRVPRSRLASDSVLALSDRSGSEPEAEHPALRNSIDDSNSIRLEAAARLHVQRYGVPYEVGINRAFNPDGITSAPHGSGPPPFVPGPIHPDQHRARYDPHDPIATASHRLNGSNAAEARTSTSSSNQTFELDNRTILAGDPHVPSDASRLIFVTEEERMWLDIIRSQRVATAHHPSPVPEGYQLALQRQHASPMRRSASVDSLAQEILDQRQHPANLTSHEIMRKKLSALQKQDVDEALKMARFLGMQAPSEEDLAWARDSMRPATRPTSQPRNDSHVSDGDSPTRPERDSAYQTWSPQSGGFNLDTQSQLRQYAISHDPPSPSSKAKLLRQPSTQQNVIPSPVPEEEPVADALEEASDYDRGRRSNSTPQRSKRLSRSVDAGPMPRAVGLPYRAATFDPRTDSAASSTNLAPPPGATSPLSSIIAAAILGDKHRRQAGGETPDTDVSRSTFGSKRSAKKAPQHARSRESGYNPRGSMTSMTSAGEDVLAAWADLGG